MRRHSHVYSVPFDPDVPPQVATAIESLIADLERVWRELSSLRSQLQAARDSHAAALAQHAALIDSASAAPASASHSDALASRAGGGWGSTHRLLVSASEQYAQQLDATRESLWDGVEQRLAPLEPLATEVAALRSRIRSLEKRYKHSQASDDDVAGLEQRLAQAERTAAGAVSRIVRLEDESARTRGASTSDVRDLVRKVEEQHQQADQIRADLKKAREWASEQLRSIRLELASAASSADVLSKFEDLRGVVDQQQSRIAKLEARAASSPAEPRRSSPAASSPVSDSRVRRVEEWVQDAGERMQRLEEWEDKAGRELTAVSSKQTALSRGHDELASRVSSLAEQLASASNRSQDRTCDTNAKRLESKVDELSKTVSMQTSTLAEQISDVSSHVSMLQSKQEIVDRIVRVVPALKKQLEATQHELESTQEVIETVRQKVRKGHPEGIDGLATRIEEMHTYLDDTRDKITKCASLTSGIESCFSSMTHKHADSNVLHIICAEDDYPWFKEFLLAKGAPNLICSIAYRFVEHKHFVSVDGPVVFTLEQKEDTTAPAKALMRTETEFIRILLPVVNTLEVIKEAEYQWNRITNPVFSDELASLEADTITTKYCVGVVYCGPGQTDEKDVLKNTTSNFH
eukprot:m51a1_g3536 hypothetical protein (635) ;mRNA; r:967874-972194